jgi:hypothetical protein
MRHPTRRRQPFRGAALNPKQTDGERRDAEAATSALAELRATRLQR